MGYNRELVFKRITAVVITAIFGMTFLFGAVSALKYQRVISYITGAVLLLFGILLLFNRFTLIVEILYKIMSFRSSLGM